MYTLMLKYALIATKPGDTMSSFKNKADIESRLKSIDNWENLFTKIKTGIKETQYQYFQWVYESLLFLS